MATEKQREAARKNIKKAQAKWKSMSASGHARSQPEGRGRQKPGTTGQGNFYHVEVRPKDEFTAFRTQDVGEHGHLQRVAGKRASGSWATSTWLISKDDAHLEQDKLVPDTKDAKDLLKKLGSTPVHLSGDRFRAKDRPDVPERSKPTSAQTRARHENIKKAQATRRRKS
ncbi:MAG TPA: hypothetical protein VK206_17480 [Anaerolineales bacterium]|nr:hypothetical protein [Anaerolineales bacterium]HLO33545.1 hypothetical protein [Anaerolineales bacterium]